MIKQIGKILRDKSVTSFEDDSYWIDFKEFQSLYSDVFELFQNEPERIMNCFEVSLAEIGVKSRVRIKNFIDCIPNKSIDRIRSNDINNLLLIKCRCSTQSDVRPQVIHAKFECPSCGTIISVLQIDKKFKEPSRCSCGRRGGFKAISKDMTDRARIEIEDLVDLTESPQTRGITSFVKFPLTESKELSKLNPGNEVWILGVLKTSEIHTKGGILTSLDVFINILEVEPCEANIDLSDFSKEEIDSYKQLSKIISDKNNLNELRESFAPEIIGNNAPKDSLLLKAAQGVGRKNNGNILFISNPGTAKSIMAKKYHSIVPGTSYISGAGSSAVGLSASVEKKEDGWILKPGVLVTTKQDAIIDEFNLLPEDDRPKLQEAMSEGQLTINKASIHARLKVSCGIIACANPINGVFNYDFNLVKQFNLPIQILNRFDAIFVIEDSKTRNGDKAIAKQMLLRESGKIKQKYSDDTLKRFFLYIRSRPEPKFDSYLTDEYIPEKYSSIRSLSNPNKNSSINPRFIESIIRMSKAMAKIKLSNSVSKEDVDFVIGILKKTYLNWGEEC